jgi:hypothetical protein
MILSEESMSKVNDPQIIEDSALREAMDDDEHFVHSLVRLGDALPLMVHEAIHDADGAKVLDSGVLINSELYHAIVGRMLSKPLDACVGIERPVRSEDLWKEALAAMDSERFYRMLAYEKNERESLAAAFADMQLPERIALRLSMAQENMPALFKGCARRALVCAYLAQKMHWKAKQIAAAASAGAALDLGMLHVDPALLAARKRLSGPERRHVFAHPLIGMICAQDAGMDREQCDAIAMHHERLDGGGYPRGLLGEGMGMLSRVAQLASSAVGMLERSGGQRSGELHLALRLNAAHFDSGLVRLLMEPIERGLAEERLAEPDGLKVSRASLMDRASLAIGKLGGVIDLVDQWSAAIDMALEDGAEQSEMDAIYKIDREMVVYRRALADVGIFGDPSMLGSVDIDEKEVEELEALASEASWQLSSIALNAARRWSTSGSEGRSSAGKTWLESVEEHAKNK